MLLEPGVGETPLWPSVCVTALFAGETPVEPLAKMLSLVPGVDFFEALERLNTELYQDDARVDRQRERLWYQALNEDFSVGDLELTEAAADWLTEHGYDPSFGARPLKRLMQV